MVDASSDLVALHLRIDSAMKEIIKDGKLDKHDIPTLVRLMTELVLTPVKLSYEASALKMSGMYDYIMTHYNLYPADETDKAAYKQLFDISLQLALFQPKIKKEVKACFPCLA
jgi:hypothetical protein